MNEEYLERISKQLDNLAIDQIPIGIKELQQENKRLTHTNKSYEGIINKLNKMIDEMAKEMYLNISMLEMAKIGQAIDYDPRKMFAGISDEEAIDCIKQYFEKRVEGK